MWSGWWKWVRLRSSLPVCSTKRADHHTRCEMKVRLLQTTWRICKGSWKWWTLTTKAEGTEKTEGTQKKNKILFSKQKKSSFESLTALSHFSPSCRESSAVTAACLLCPKVNTSITLPTRLPQQPHNYSRPPLQATLSRPYQMHPSRIYQPSKIPPSIHTFLSGGAGEDHWAKNGVFTDLITSFGEKKGINKWGGFGWATILYTNVVHKKEVP